MSNKGSPYHAELHITQEAATHILIHPALTIVVTPPLIPEGAEHPPKGSEMPLTPFSQYWRRNLSSWN